MMLIWTQPKKLRDVPGYAQASYGEKHWIELEYRKKWKAWPVYRRRKGETILNRIDIRTRLSSCVVISVYVNGDVFMSANGKIKVTDELFDAIAEARKAIGRLD